MLRLRHMPAWDTRAEPPPGPVCNAANKRRPNAPPVSRLVSRSLRWQRRTRASRPSTCTALARSCTASTGGGGGPSTRPTAAPSKGPHTHAGLRSASPTPTHPSLPPFPPCRHQPCTDWRLQRRRNRRHVRGLVVGACCLGGLLSYCLFYCLLLGTGGLAPSRRVGAGREAVWKGAGPGFFRAAACRDSFCPAQATLTRGAGPTSSPPPTTSSSSCLCMRISIATTSCERWGHCVWER